MSGLQRKMTEHGSSKKNYNDKKKSIQADPKCTDGGDGEQMH
jgi:hypothetical protein